MQSALVEIAGLIVVKSSHTETELRIMDILRRAELHLDLPSPSPKRYGVWVTPSEADAQNCQPTWAKTTVDDSPATGRWVRAEFAVHEVAVSFAKLGFLVGRAGWTYEVREIPDDGVIQP